MIYFNQCAFVCISIFIGWGILMLNFRDHRKAGSKLAYWLLTASVYFDFVGVKNLLVFVLILLICPLSLIIFISIINFIIDFLIESHSTTFFITITYVDCCILFTLFTTLLRFLRILPQELFTFGLACPNFVFQAKACFVAEPEPNGASN